MTRIFRRILILAILGGTVGCGAGPERSPTAIVSGDVTLDGEAIEQGTIIFEAPDLRPASGKIVDGKIVDVMTYEPGDGVPVGTHKIAIQVTSLGDSVKTSDPSSTAPVDLNYMGGGESLIPEKYSDPSTSGLTAEIVAGENKLSFDLQSK